MLQQKQNSAKTSIKQVRERTLSVLEKRLKHETFKKNLETIKQTDLK